jgi:hypothetical protein
VVAKVWERLPVSKRAARKFDMEKFNLKKLNDVEINSIKLKYQIGLQLWKTRMIMWKFIGLGKVSERM